MDSFAKLDPSRVCKIRLEDVRKDQELLRKVIEFIGIKYDSTFFEYLQTPRNVFFPLDFQLTESQLNLFNRICSQMMERLGYKNEELYIVKY